MGMPITVEIVDSTATDAITNAVFDYFDRVDRKFSTYKADSEISQINRGELTLSDVSPEMQEIFALAKQTRLETDGYFDIWHKDMYDPSGIVKGWAIFQAARLLKDEGFENYYVEAGGDVQAEGKNALGTKWRVGIRNPFNLNEIVKVVGASGCGVATSGTSIRGQHIYNPKKDGELLTEIVSLTVIGPNIYEADRFATAAFAMGREGIYFIERRQGLEGYMIDQNGKATLTTGFGHYEIRD